MARKRDDGSDCWPKAYPKELVDKDCGWTEDNIYLEIEDDETFHIGQCYELEAAKTLECSQCGGRDFNVGKGSYFTAIRCVKCKWEVCVHDG